MRDVYPRLLGNVEEDVDDDRLYANFLYLEEHGLCDSGVRIGMDGHIAWGGAKITARGLDFLEDDGGLTALLGVVTVRFEAETIRALIDARIDSAPLDADKKSKFKGLVATLSEAALKAAMTDLVHAGLRQIPEIGQWIERLGAFR